MIADLSPGRPPSAPSAGATCHPATSGGVFRQSLPNHRRGEGQFLQLKRCRDRLRLRRQAGIR